MHKLKINPRFQAALRPLTDSEFSALEASILKDGITDPVVIWMDQIVDGYHRHTIAQKHKMETPVRCRSFKDEDAALAWIQRNQAGRRNLNEHELKLVIAKEYDAQKKEEGRPEKRYQNETVLSSDPTKTKTEPRRTREKVAESHGVSQSTVNRSVKYAEAFDKLPKGVKALIEEKPARATEAAVLKMATMTAEELAPIARDVRVGNVATLTELVKPQKNGSHKEPPKKRPAKGKEKESAAVVVDQIIKAHFSGATGLPQSIDRVAKLNGGKGAFHTTAEGALEDCLKALKEMRKGSR